MPIEVTRDVIDAMTHAAKAAHPKEACGLLLGRGGQITRFVATANVHPRPETHFEIDPQALIDAHRDERDGGAAIMGYFHSHPTGQPSPSPADQAHSARDGTVWVIAGGGDLAFWSDDPGGFRALSYSVVER